MPELCRFEGMIIKMFFFDNKQHHKPHIHVYYAENKATIGLDGELLEGALPQKKFTLLQAWLILREKELYSAWNNAVRNMPLGKIEPIK